MNRVQPVFDWTGVDMKLDMRVDVHRPEYLEVIQIVDRAVTRTRVGVADDASSLSKAACYSRRKWFK